MSGIRIAIDRGGTFTDVIATNIPGQSDAVVFKLLSENPANYADAPIEGIRRVLSLATAYDLPRGEPLDTSSIASIRMGTTVATNALLQRKGARCALITTRGFGDLLAIGTQSRPDIFALAVRKPGMLYERVVEVDERVTMEEFTENQRPMDAEALQRRIDTDPDLLRCENGDVVRILERPDMAQIKADLRALKDDGIESIAIVFAHSYYCSLSSELSPSIKMVSRGLSATADAYLTPVTKTYIGGFRSGFNGCLEADDTVRCDFMMSDGGLANWKSFSAVKAILSGPAGGYVGFAKTSYAKSDGRPVIGFDMGGTSTDVSRYGGSYEHIFESATAGITLQVPQLDINTVAAGGGSILAFRNGLFCVGPESAGAHPGPTCYRKGGPLAVTDANLLLGRLMPEYFPSIFGHEENLPLDSESSRSIFLAMADQVKRETGQDMTPEEVALGFIDVANETMARPIRALTQARGYEPSAHRLAVFGGAGGQHACAMARLLEINSVIIHKYSSILSAYGIYLAEVTDEQQAPASEEWDDDPTSTRSCRLRERAATLKDKVVQNLASQQGIPAVRIETTMFLSMRFQGTDTNLMIEEPADGDYKTSFKREFFREFTYLPQDRSIFVDGIRVRGTGTVTNAGAEGDTLTPFAEMRALEKGVLQQFVPQPEKTSRVYFKALGWVESAVYILDKLSIGAKVAVRNMGRLQYLAALMRKRLKYADKATEKGPAMMIDNTQTIVILPGCTARVFSRHVVIDIPKSTQVKTKELNAHATKIKTRAAIPPNVPLVRDVDPVLMSVFGHRFMSIAEQMGQTLQKTCVSIAIKERLDFSCALFDSQGGLCANAPHVPVHLGSMQGSIQFQHALHSKTLKPGDVLVTNHPQAGGTHLPDVTVISPAFDAKGETTLFYVASRAHHLDIGGLAGNSMHPDAKELWEEGAAIMSFKLLSQGIFDEAGITKLLVDEPGQYPGCYGSRHLSDNLSDLRAQVAANARGIHLLTELSREYGVDTVQFYMRAIQATAEASVRQYLRETAARLGPVLEDVDYFDDGSEIRLRVTIDIETGGATFDFAGTSPEVHGNSNAPRSITMSAAIYALRCVVGTDIPMNQGVLAPVTFQLPDDPCLINPSADAAVSTGNALTSQRLVDLFLKTFRAASGSQGCMNCLGMLGGPRSDGGYDYAYGETVCGGNGAGPTWSGSPVPTQTHMTNTRATDIETLEKRYPLIMREFSIRRGSGGEGFHRGGDGCVRVFEAHEPLDFSFMSERRVQAPYALAGGRPGAQGLNLWRKKKRAATTSVSGTQGEREEKGKKPEYRTVNLGPRSIFTLQPGDQFVINTPGGGGWGAAPEDATLPLPPTPVANGSRETYKGPLPAQIHTIHYYPRAVGSVAAWKELQDGQ